MNTRLLNLALATFWLTSFQGVAWAQHHGHASGGFVDARSFVPAPAVICLRMVRLSPAAAIRLPAIRPATAPATAAGLRMRPRTAALMPIFDVGI